MHRFYEELCTVNPGGVLTLVSVGSCTVTTSQAGDGRSQPRHRVPQTFTVSFPASTGYWLVGRGGGVFAFGDAHSTALPATST
ncbi:MAG: hypothetical protein ACRDZX_02095 [Acidimicrobiales bacterium]